MLLIIGMLKKKKIYLADVSKHNLNSEKQAILLMISNGEGQWQYLAVKTLLALLTEMIFKNHSDFYCLNCLHAFANENKGQYHKSMWK